jgi:hypothetical protein
MNKSPDTTRPQNGGAGDDKPADGTDGPDQPGGPAAPEGRRVSGASSASGNTRASSSIL